MLKVLGSHSPESCYMVRVEPMRKRLLPDLEEAFARPIQTKRLPGVRGRQKAVTSPRCGGFYVQRVFYLI